MRIQTEVAKFNKANRNSKYQIDLLVPEVITVTFSEEEIPLVDFPAPSLPEGTATTGTGWLERK